MGWRWNRGAYEVRAYNPNAPWVDKDGKPRKGKMVYVTRRKLERDAKKAFRDATDEFSSETPSDTTIRAYAEQWLDEHHGPGTNRPAKGTRQVNEGNLRAFLAEFGDRPLNGGIGRKEALRWSKTRHHIAKTVSAMFNDAVDDEECEANPFANRKHKRSTERRLIAPITQAELDHLTDIALRHWGEDGYGQIAKAWVLFAAWVGCRPGETFSVPLKNVDWHRGLVAIRRVKPPYDTDVVVLPSAAKDQLEFVRSSLAQEGPMFRTVTGRPMVKGSLSYHWTPIRSAFREKVTPDRWGQLTEGERDLDLYVLRHRVASVMADRGATAREIAAQLGNTPDVCERSYIHPFKSDVRDRNRKLLDDASVVDLQSVRERNGA